MKPPSKSCICLLFLLISQIHANTIEKNLGLLDQELVKIESTINLEKPELEPFKDAYETFINSINENFPLGSQKRNLALLIKKYYELLETSRLGKANLLDLIQETRYKFLLYAYAYTTLENALKTKPKETQELEKQLKKEKKALKTHIKENKEKSKEKIQKLKTKIKDIEKQIQENETEKQKLNVLIDTKLPEFQTKFEALLKKEEELNKEKEKKLNKIKKIKEDKTIENIRNNIKQTEIDIKKNKGEQEIYTNNQKILDYIKTLAPIKTLALEDIKNILQPDSIELEKGGELKIIPLSTLEAFHKKNYNNKASQGFAILRPYFQ